MAFTFWRPTLSRIAAVLRRAADTRARRRRSGSRSIESLETRALLTFSGIAPPTIAPPANIDAKLIGGSLYVTGYQPGTRAVTVSPLPGNPQFLQIVPGANTLVNGSMNPAIFRGTDIKGHVFVDLNTGFDAKNTSDVSIDATGFTLPGSLFVKLNGLGGDELEVLGGTVAGSVFVDTFQGDDRVFVRGVTVNQTTNVDLGPGRNLGDIETSLFRNPFCFNGGPNGNSQLFIDDTTFQSTFIDVSGGQLNRVVIEQDPTLPGATNFNGFTQFCFPGALVIGGGGDVLVGIQDPASQTNFRSKTDFYGATIGLAVSNTSFTQTPYLIFSKLLGLDITTQTLPGWTQNFPGYSQTIKTFGGFGPLQFSISQGTLPAGLSLNPTTGVISGTPTVIGTANFTVRVNGVNGFTDTQALSITVNPPVLVTTTTLAPWTQGIAGYNQTVSATGGTGAKTFSVFSGALPSGLILNATTGQITGLPALAGTFNFTVRATDSIGAFDDQLLSILVNLPVDIITLSLPNTTVGQNYGQPIVAINGTGNKTLSVSAGVLPTGLSIIGSTIAGTTTQIGSFAFTLRATDTVGSFDEQAYTITVNSAVNILTTSLPSWTQDLAGYAQPIAAVGGTGALAFSVTTGNLPTGLALDASTGVLAGTPSVAGTFNFTVRATDTVGAFDDQAYSLLINSPVQIVTTTLPATTIGASYSQLIDVVGGTGAKNLSVVSGALPAGLQIVGSSIVGVAIPAQPGPFDFTIRATDTLGAFDDQAYTLQVNDSVQIVTTSLPNWTVGTAGYSQPIVTTGGTGDKTLSVVSGVLPTGLSVVGSSIQGTPTQIGTFNFTLRATDTVGASDEQAYSVTINSSLAITTTSLPAWTQDLPGYSQTIATVGGTAPLAFSVSAGALPAGLNLNSATGLLSGTPTAAGTFAFTILATDSAGAVDDQAYTLQVNTGVQIVTTSLPNWTVGTAGYSQPIVTTGGTGAKTLSVVAGVLPTGLSIAGSSIQGTPTQIGTFNLTLRATDTVGAFDDQTYSVAISSTLAITTTSLPPWTQDLPGYGQTIATVGGTTPLAFSVSAGALPAGLNLDSATGQISGTPTAAGTFLFTILATDSVGASDDQTLSLLVNPPVSITTTTLPDTSLGATYLQPIDSVGGTGDKTAAVVSGALPAGLQLVDSVIVGTVSAGQPTGPYNFTIRATDTLGAFDDQSYTVTVNAQVEIVTTSLPDSTVGVAYNETLQVDGGTGPISLSLQSGTLPTGLSLMGLSIGGTPTQIGTFDFTIRASDSFGAFDDQTFTVTINPAVNITTTGLPNWTVDAPGYSQTLAFTGGTGAVTLSLFSGDLPTGVTLDSATGVLSGTPTVAAVFNFVIEAVDSVGSSDTQSFSVTINPALVIQPTSLPNPLVGQGYAQLISSTGGTGARTYAVTAGALPDGLTLDSATGLLAGTATTAGPFSFTVLAIDSVGATDTQDYTVSVGTVNPIVLEIVTTSLANWTVDLPGYSQNIITSGGTGTVTFSLDSGTLPTGLTLSAAGALTGTPTVANTFNFTVLATDGVGNTDTQAYTVVINAAVAVTPATLPNGTTGTAYAALLSATGGTGARTFAVTAGDVPTGLTLNAGTGLLSGTPTVASTFSFTITATDSVGATGSQAYTVTINAPVAPLTITTTALPGWTVNLPGYSQVVATTGGTAPVTFSVSSGALPAGLSLDGGTGEILGTPTAVGTFNFTFLATDALGQTDTQDLSIVVNAAVDITTLSLVNGTVGLDYAKLIKATGGTGSKTFAVTAGTLPDGLALESDTGLLSGTPTTASTFNFTVTATDTVGAADTQAYTVTINAAPVPGAPTITTTSLPNWTVDIAGYSQTITTVGGTGAITFAVTTGSLPTGLSLNTSTGLVSGTPSATGTFTFTVTATDALAATDTQDYTVVINAAVDITTLSLPNGKVGLDYAKLIAVTGGTGAKTFAVTAGALPDGLTLASDTGLLSGTPTTANTFNFTITATDTVGSADSQAYSVTISSAPVPGAPTITTTSLPNWTVDATGYSQTIATTGGTGAITFAVTTGSLPTGLSLNTSTGLVSGTPTATGTFTFTVTATDSVAATDTQDYTVVINATIDITPTSLPNGTVGVDYAKLIKASGGTGTKTFAVTAGALPGGLSLDSETGLVSGTPTTANTFDFTITATDTVGATDAQAYTVVIAAVPSPVSITTTTLPDWTQNFAGYSATVVATGGVGAKTFSISTGSLPNGLTLNTTTGVISGTPTTIGTFNFTVSATDTVGESAFQNFRVVINAPLALTPTSLPGGFTTILYNRFIFATGGTGGHTMALSNVVNPFANIGVQVVDDFVQVFGLTNITGTVSFRVTVTDSVGASTFLDYSITFS